MSKYILSIFCWSLVPFFLLEIAIRFALFTPYFPFSSLSDPLSYFDPLSDDNYWKLVAYQRKSEARWYPDGSRIHPLIGWTQTNITPENPHGLRPRPLATFASLKPKIVFYGDSFVRGDTDSEFGIPYFIEKELASFDVLDFGVGGFGLDQIFLFFKESSGAFAHPIILVGVLLEDIDRTILEMRTYQKPRFRIDGAGIRLTNIPIESDPEKYLADHPPQVSSYLLAAILRAYRNKYPSLEERREKSLLTRRILEAFQEHAAVLQVPIGFVIFYAKDQLTTVSWQETLLKSTLTDLSLQYFDTKPVMAPLVSEPTGQGELLFSKSGHHSALGNRIIGESLTKWVKQEILPR